MLLIYPKWTRNALEFPGGWKYFSDVFMFGSSHLVLYRYNELYFTIGVCFTNTDELQAVVFNNFALMVGVWLLVH